MYTLGPGIGPIIQLHAKSNMDVDIFNMGKECDEHFFKKTYHQYNPFSIEHHTGDVTVNKFGDNIIYDIPKKGHLIKSVFLFIELSKTVKSFWSNGVIFSLIKNVKIRCSNNEFYSIPGQYLYIYNSLHMPYSKQMQYKKMSGCFNTDYSLIDFSKSNNVFIVQIPIFDFFPLASIGNNDVRITVETNDISKLLRVYTDEQDNVNVILNVIGNLVRTTLNTQISTNSNLQSKTFLYQFMVDYIYLDDSQLKLFITKELKYKIEQVNYKQVITPYTNLITIDLDEFENPTTQLIVTVERQDYISNNIYLKYLPIQDITLVLNSIKRKDKVDGIYIHNSSSNLNYTKNIYCISFELSHDKNQNSGSYNFTETNNNFLELSLDSMYKDVKLVINIYGPCYNFATIHNRQFSVMFS